MSRIPEDLDLSPVVGEFATQVKVGPSDLQFDFGPVHFTIETSVKLFRDKKQFAVWEAGKWPEPGFYDVMNVDVTGFDVADDRLIILKLKNELEMHLEVDPVDGYESMCIRFNNAQQAWYF